MTDRRLDDLVMTLAKSQPMLDDGTRARVAAALAAAVNRGPAVEPGPRSAPTGASLDGGDATGNPGTVSQSDSDATGNPGTVSSLLAGRGAPRGNRRPANAVARSREASAQARAPRTRPTDLPRWRRHRAGLIGCALGVTMLAAASIAIVAWPPDPSSMRAPLPAASPRMRPVSVPPPLEDEPRCTAAQAILRAALRDAEPAARTQAVEVLGKLEDVPSIPALVELTEQDPDDDVRGVAAETLAAIGAAAAVPLLQRLETAARPPLKVSYASALAQLGDASASRRLLAYADSKDLTVSFKAWRALADRRLPTSPQVIAALEALASRATELDELQPYAGTTLLTRLAALQGATARKTLHALLEQRDEGERVAAADGLARLGDDAGRQVLRDVLANQSSPNRLVAAVAQIAIGDHSGRALMIDQLDARDPASRKLAARGLGEIGDRRSLAALVAHANAPEWSAKIATAAAIAAITCTRRSTSTWPRTTSKAPGAP